VVIHALILRSWYGCSFQPFNIPSGSMIPTLLVGDYLFVSKYSYGYSRYSFPFGPNLFSGRIWSKEPERGDVVVFKLPRDNDTDYIKRVIAAGDEIQMVHGVLRINGSGEERARQRLRHARPFSRERHLTRYMEPAEQRNLSRARPRR
jgi:signal peptidase I